MRDQLARAAVSQVLSRVRSGRIDVVEAGRERSFGPADAELRATLAIHDPAAWRAALHGSVGLGEAYVDGLWETDDLVALIRIAARELRDLDGLRGAVARPRGALHRLRRLVPENTRDGSRRNISAHYDLGNDLFAAFLDERMMYSCAYFPSDGASLAILSNRLQGVAKKMANTLLRTGRSGVLNIARDFSCCIVTRAVNT